MDSLSRVVDDIKTLKIQGATNIAKTGLEALLSLPDEKISEAIEQLKTARPTEPLLSNCLRLVQLRGKSVILPTLTRLEDISVEIVKNGLPLIKEGNNILTHCHSSTAIKLLKEARREGVNFRVYLTETRPIFQGKLTAKELVSAGIPSVMITDSEAAFLISRHDNREINMIFLGADAIAVNGSVVNKVGSYGIALSAYEAKIPLYVLATLLKFSQEPIVIEERSQDEVWEEKPEDLEIFNPSFDAVPPKLITSIICEFGRIKPGKVRTIIKKNYSWIFEKIKDSGSEREKKKKTSPYWSYLHLGEKIDGRKNIIALFRLGVEKNVDFNETAGGIAAESSVGTWTKIETEIKNIFEHLHARVITTDKTTGLVKIAYPLELFEPGNLPQLLSSVAGNIFGLKEAKKLKLLDLEFPEKYVKNFPGPALGIEGIRRLTGIFDRPLVGCIIKPKLGLDPESYARIASEVFDGGIDFVKDDENLTSQGFNTFRDRVKKITGRCQFFLKTETKRSQQPNKIYAFNITAPTDIMLERAKFVRDKGGNCVMIDFLTAGFAALASLRKRNYDLIIHGHRAMHAAFDRMEDHGISMLVLAKLARLAGIDSLHTGTAVGKMEGKSKEVVEINKFLLSEWYGLKLTLPVASGGLHPALVPLLVKTLGKDVLLNFGGGIHGHPKGSRAGAIAVMAAVQATQKGIPLLEYARNNEELALALDYWE